MTAVARGKTRTVVGLTALLLLVAGGPGGPGATPARADGATVASTSRTSVTSGEDQRFKDAYSPEISRSGRWVVFESPARFVPHDTNGWRDIYLRDRWRGRTILVSVAADGGASLGPSVGPSMTSDGRFIAFEAFADDVVAGDDNNNTDIVVRDMVTGTTTLASLGVDGSQTVGANAWSTTASISGDGRYVAFQSLAPNLVTGDGNNDADIFVRDRVAATTEIISVNANDEEGDGETFGSPSISADGRLVAFSSRAQNLVPNDTNDTTDVFLRDRQAETTLRASEGPGGVQADMGSQHPAISGNGQFLAFASPATNLGTAPLSGAQSHVYVRDLATETNQLASVSTTGLPGDDSSSFPAMSKSGRFVVFQSTATTLIPGDTNAQPDVFVRDLTNAVTHRLSVSTEAVESNGSSGNSGPAISSNGQHVTFESSATNLAPDDTNEVTDVFARLRWDS